MLSSADHRVFSTSEDRFQRCTFCGKGIVVLPNDQRGGSCFDCLSLLGPNAMACPECGSEIPSAQRAIGCGRCGWSPIPD
ncbi:MAG TPA: hypothetical protein VGS23_01225 [Thermoplasmata archaeon]|nr:hypothetical protein [Thermoplasmata archaeon]